MFYRFFHFLIFFLIFITFFSYMYSEQDEQRLHCILNRLPIVDFDESMGKYDTDFFKKYSWLASTYDELRGLYINRIPQHMKIHAKPLIPKIIHQIWMGGQLPEKFKKWQQSWIINHPGWEYRLWTDNDIESFGMKNKILFDRASNYGEKSDIWRYEILERYGGLYVDVDCESLQPFDLLHHMYDFYAALEPLDYNLWIGNAIIACSAHHPIIQLIIDCLSSTAKADNTWFRTGPHMLTEKILKNKSNMTPFSVILPATYFSPKRHKDRQNNIPSSQWLKPESFAVHHYAGSWLK